MVVVVVVVVVTMKERIGKGKCDESRWGYFVSLRLVCLLPFPFTSFKHEVLFFLS
jgi:hypothetical protein